MITTIQTSTEYLENLQPIILEYNATVYNNENRDNSFLRLKDMLDIEVDDYRLHLQDDVSLAYNLKLYIDIRLIDFMNTHKIDILSLSGKPMKSISIEYFLGRRVADNARRPFFHLNNVGVIYSKKFINIMKEYSINSNHIDDVSFINDIFKDIYCSRQIHLPTLVQSKLHPINNLFDKNFLIDYKI